MLFCVTIILIKTMDTQTQDQNKNFESNMIVPESKKTQNFSNKRNLLIILSAIVVLCLGAFVYMKVSQEKGISKEEKDKIVEELVSKETAIPEIQRDQMMNQIFNNN